jgi:hypothetical protein
MRNMISALASVGFFGAEKEIRLEKKDKLGGGLA